LKGAATPVLGRRKMKTVMATLPKTDYPHITKDANVCHGAPCIAGTRLRVMDIVAASEEGVSPKDLQTYFSSRPLTLGEVYAALAYYSDNKDEIEADFAEAERVNQEGLKHEAGIRRRS
jgi:uncharacterized protein (DUF433 family)